METDSAESGLAELADGTPSNWTVEESDAESDEDLAPPRPIEDFFGPLRWISAALAFAAAVVIGAAFLD